MWIHNEFPFNNIRLFELVVREPDNVDMTLKKECNIWIKERRIIDKLIILKYPCILINIREQIALPIIREISASMESEIVLT